MKDFVVLDHAPTGKQMLVAIDAIEAVVPDGEGCRVYVSRHVYFVSGETVSEVTAKLAGTVTDDQRYG